jgi:sugar lactone lactonase YvrE
MNTVDLVHDSRNIVGESIVWDDQMEVLLWVDIVDKLIIRFDPLSGAYQTWETEELPTSIGLCADGGAIVGFAQRVALWDFNDTFTTLAIPEPAQPANRLNDGRVAPDGSFWVGTMQNNLGPDGMPAAQTARTGRLYRIGHHGDVTQLTDDQFGITNTLAWLPDGQFVTADTIVNQLYSYRVAKNPWALRDRKLFSAPFDRGLPDGSCVDSEGYLWTCRVCGGYAVTRTAPDGEVVQTIDLPCSWPTSCTFGGASLDTLYITSARFTLSPDHLRANPHEGGLFAVRPGVTGRIENRFGQVIQANPRTSGHRAVA